MGLHKYIIAVKREKRASAPLDWQKILYEIEGIEIIGGSGKIMQIQATDEAIEIVRSRLSSFCYIEPIITHTTRNVHS